MTAVILILLHDTRLFPPTNLITEEAEYYALDPDDALTLNLGVNPLLQFGLKTTRARLITNILNAIAVSRLCSV